MVINFQFINFSLYVAGPVHVPSAHFKSQLFFFLRRGGGGNLKWSQRTLRIFYVLMHDSGGSVHEALLLIGT